MSSSRLVLASLTIAMSGIITLSSGVLYPSANAKVDVPIFAPVGASRVTPAVPNKPEDVKAVKQRLRDLGFDWIPDTDKMDTLTIHTLKLFQAIVRDKDKVKIETGVDGIVDPNGFTHKWLKSDNAPKWMLMPASGTGFKNYERVEQVQDDHDFGTDWLAETIKGAGKHYNTNYLAANASASLIVVNDSSRDCGRDTKDHKGHETGSMVDIRLPKKDGTAGGITVADGTYDRDAMRAIITAFHNQSNFQKARLNDATLAAEKIAIGGVERPLCVVDAGGGTVHDNHLHVDIKPPAR